MSSRCSYCTGESVPITGDRGRPRAASGGPPDRAARAARLPPSTLRSAGPGRVGRGDRRLAAEPRERERAARVDLADARRLDVGAVREVAEARRPPRPGYRPSTRPTASAMPAFLTSRPSSRSTPASRFALMPCTTSLTGALFSMISPTSRDRLVEAGGDLAQREDRRDEVEDEREDDQDDREDRDCADCHESERHRSPIPRRRGSRRASRRSRRRPRPSASPGPASSAAAPRRRGPSSPAAATVAICCTLGTMLFAAFSTPRSRNTTTGKTTTSRTALPIHQRVIAASSRRRSRPCAPIPGSAPRMIVELRVDRLDRALERAQVLGLDALQRGGERREPVGDPQRGRGAPRSARRRARARRRAPARRSGGRGGACCSCASEPVGERVHVAVLHDRLVDDQREHRRGRLELRDVGRVRGDLAGDLEQAVDRLLDAARRRRMSTASRAATTSAATRPMSERDPPVAVRRDRRERSFADRHLSQRAGGVQDPHARVVDLGDARRARRSGCARPRRRRPRSSPAWRSCIASSTIMITITAATAMTTTPSAIPTCHSVDDASTEPNVRTGARRVKSASRLFDTPRPHAGPSRHRSRTRRCSPRSYRRPTGRAGRPQNQARMRS